MWPALTLDGCDQNFTDMLDHRLSVRGRICHFLATKMSIWCENSLPQDCESLPPILRPLLRLLALQVSARLQRLLCLPWSCPSMMLRLSDLQQNYTWWLCQHPLWLERLGAEAERLAFYVLLYSCFHRWTTAKCWRRRTTQKKRRKIQWFLL